LELLLQQVGDNLPNEAIILAGNTNGHIGRQYIVHGGFDFCSLNGNQRIFWFIVV